MTNLNCLFLVDTACNANDVKQAVAEVSIIFEDNANVRIQPHYRYEDYSNLPYQIYYDKYWGINQQWLRSKASVIKSKWAEELTHVVFIVKDSNWYPGLNGNRVWGWNISTTFSGYHIQQVRFDSRNNINTKGTLYHELGHSLNTFIFEAQGVWVDTTPYIDLAPYRYDHGFVHGEHKDWEYIRNDENQKGIAMIAEPLRASIEKTQRAFDTKVALMQRVFSLLERMVILYNRLILEYYYKKKDVAFLSDGTCNLK